jgi:hypothetical protein
MSQDHAWRPPPELVVAVHDLSDRVVSVLRPAALACGYALGVHGSLERDLDLIAAPWTDDAAAPLVLVMALQAAITTQIGECYRSAEVEQKPHGRLAWVLHFQSAVSTPNGAYPFVDLSVMPRLAAD